MSGKTDESYILELMSVQVGMTENQANAFADNFSVIDTFTDPGSGFSASLFLDTNGNNYLAIRGTEKGFSSAADWLTNVGDISADGIAIDQGIALFNYLQRLQGLSGEPVAQYAYEFTSRSVIRTFNADANGLLSNKKVSVVGHSLGGHLAMMASRLAPSMVSDVYTFNAPGFDTTLRTTLSPLTSNGFFNILRDTSIDAVTGDIGAVWDVEKISNFYVDGDVVHGLGIVPGFQGNVYAESADQGIIDAHGIAEITDALAVGDLLYGLDQNHDMPSLNNVLKSSSNIPNESLENTVNALGDIFNIGATVSVDDRDGLYERIQAIKDSGLYQQSTGRVNVVLLAGFVPEAFAAQAKSDAGILYALENLNPFAIVGNNSLYSAFDPNDYSEKYLLDRALLLEDKLIRATHDYPQSGTGTKLNGRSQFAGKQLHLIDQATGYSAHKYKNSPVDVEMTIEFGTDTAGDVLAGTEGINHLYGRGGDDSIDGNGGNDYLEGGDGFDTYNYTSGDDFDDILDSDGSGQIIYDDAVLTGGEAKYVNSNTYEDDEGVVYSLIDGNLVISKYSEQGGGLRVLDFQDGDLGISLSSHQPPPPPPVIVQTNNSIFSGDENDNYIEGLDGNNEIRGQDGNDQIWGGNGDDILMGRKPVGSNETYMPILFDDDALYGGFGNDILYGHEGNDRLFGEQGRDDLFGGLGDDYLNGGDEQDTLLGGHGADILYGGAENDGLWGEDPLMSEIDITLNGETYLAKSDWLYGEAGNDVLMGSFGSDSLYGGSGIDLLYGDNPNFSYIAGDDYLNGGTGADTLWGGPGDDTLIGGEDDDILYGEDGNDTIEAGAGLDQVDAGIGDDLIYGGDDRDILIAGDGNDMLYGDSGDDDLFGGKGNDGLVGGDDNDRLQGGSGRDSLQGGDGDDVLFGEGGKDVLVGGDGNDQLTGGAGADVLIGGKGDDLINAQTEDTIIFRVGDGQDTVILEDSTPEFNFEGFLPNALSVSLTPEPGAAYTMHLGLGNDGVTISNGYLSSSQFYNFDGRHLDQREVMQYLSAAINLSGTQANDILYGSNFGDLIAGSDGDDTLYGQGGDDSLYGDEGADQLYGGDGGDVLYGGQDDDTLLGQAGNDTLFGEAGADYLDGGTGDDDMLGGAGDDIYVVDSVNDLVQELPGEGTDLVESSVNFSLGDDLENLSLTGSAAIDGAGNANINNLNGNDADNVLAGLEGDDKLYGLDGNDRLEGGAGNDRLYGGKGDDVFVLELNGNTDRIIDLQGSNAIEFGAGVLPDSVSPSAYQGDDGAFYLRIDYGIAGDYVLIKNGLSGAIDEYRFQVDGSVISHAALVGDGPLPSRVQGTENNDTISGGNQADRLEGHGGNDVISGADGDDWLEGGAGDDELYGDNGSDRLDGGTGDDTLSGGSGSDTYVLRWGMGEDLVIETDGASNTLQLDNGIELGDVATSLQGDDLLVRLTGSDNGVRIKDYASTSQVWQVEDAQGGSLAVGDLASTQGLVNADDYLQDFRDKVRGIFNQELGKDGFRQAPDGSMQKNYTDIFSSSIRTNFETRVLSETLQVDTLNQNIYRLSDPDRNFQNTLLSTSESSTANYDGGTGDNALNASGTGTFYSVPSYASGIQIPEGAAIVAVSGESSLILDESYGTPDAPFNTQGYWVFDDAADADIGTGNSFNAVNHSVYQRDYEVIFEEITGGDIDNIIRSSGQTLVDSGLGNDRVTILGDRAPSWNFSIELDPNNIGAMLYGNDGNDTLFGGDRNDTLLGGNGDDVLNGHYGADTYVILGGESGTTLIADGGTLQPHPELEQYSRYTSWFYDSIGYPEWLDDSSSNIPLATLPSNIARNDFLAMEQLYGAGVFPVDTVEFGEGISLADITLSIGAYTPSQDADALYPDITESQPFGSDPHQTLDITIPGGGITRILLPNALNDNVSEGMSDRAYLLAVSKNMGAGIELFRFADGQVLTMTEMLALAGVAGGVATDGDDLLSGTAGDDVIDGLKGADQMTGGQGNDLYLVDNAGDLVVELPDEGVDKVQSRIDYALGQHVEDLRLVGGAVEGYGNELDNTITGNARDNSLYGVSGNDVLTGGGGNDDLYGGNGDDRLKGSSGDDRMYGGAGDDIYIVDTAGDVVSELADDGVDRVQSKISYTLGSNVEDLTLSGTAIEARGNTLGNSLKGNALDNRIYGEDGDDILRGRDGHDELFGGSGNDILRGDGGDDSYYIDRGDGIDEIVDNDPTPNTDSLLYGNDIHHDQLWFTQSGNNLNISVIGTGDMVTVNKWYKDTSRQVEAFISGDGLSLANSDVDQLVQAMAGLVPPANGELELTPELHAQLDTVLAASWQ